MAFTATVIKRLSLGNATAYMYEWDGAGVTSGTVRVPMQRVDLAIPGLQGATTQQAPSVNIANNLLTLVFPSGAKGFLWVVGVG